MPMWPLIKHWSDWARESMWANARGPQPQALQFSFEKSGLTLHDQPIPWNAEAVLVEAVFRIPGAARRKSEFTIRMPGQPARHAEALRSIPGTEDRCHLVFRFPPPPHSVSAEVCFRQQRLGQLTLPLLGRDEFLQSLRLQLPTLFVRLGDQNVACQTFVATQCRGLTASALVVSPTSLLPLLDLGVHVEVRSDRTGVSQVMPARLTSSQLVERQALLSVVPRKFPRRMGTWTVTWTVGDRVLATQRVRAISQRQFQHSLRVVDTRFVLQRKKAEMTLEKQAPPLEEVERLGPCFLVMSREPGMAGICPLRLSLIVSAGSPPAPWAPQEILITDGPTLVAPGTFDTRDLKTVTAFELLLKSQMLGHLPMSPAPEALFTSEGGFKSATDYTWSLAADDQLNERLGRLLDDGKE